MKKLLIIIMNLSLIYLKEEVIINMIYPYILNMEFS
jgi:hypothetical protein